MTDGVLIAAEENSRAKRWLVQQSMTARFCHVDWSGKFEYMMLERVPENLNLECSNYWKPLRSSWFRGQVQIIVTWRLKRQKADANRDLDLPTTTSSLHLRYLLFHLSETQFLSPERTGIV